LYIYGLVSTIRKLVYMKMLDINFDLTY